MNYKPNNINEEVDDWNPEITKKDSILNKTIVNFTSKHFFEIL